MHLGFHRFALEANGPPANVGFKKKKKKKSQKLKANKEAGAACFFSKPQKNIQHTI